MRALSSLLTMAAASHCRRLLSCPVLDAASAARLDALLFSVQSLDSLMELAGLAVAQATHAVYPPATHRRVLIVAGPGNNGGDGLVAARHLSLFNYDVVVCYPKPGSSPLFTQLVQQLHTHGVTVLPSLPADFPSNFDVMLDAVFGFGFKGEVRAPFNEVLRRMSAASERAPALASVTTSVSCARMDSAPVLYSNDAQCSGIATSVLRSSGGSSNASHELIPLVSVDVPSGWVVDAADDASSGSDLRPSMLISLTAPKPCAAAFDGPHHWLGGRFLTAALAAEFGLTGLPPFPGSSQIVKIS